MSDKIKDLVGASGEPEDRFAPCNGTDPMEHFWTAVKRGWDIEPREYFEREAVPMGFRSPVEMAVHHMWKRRVNEDRPAAASVPSPPAQEMDASRTTIDWRKRYDDLLELCRLIWPNWSGLQEPVVVGDLKDLTFALGEYYHEVQQGHYSTPRAEVMELIQRAIVAVRKA